MEWNVNDILILEKAVSDRYSKMRSELRTDRKNLSELWNRHLSTVGVTLVRPSKARRTIDLDIFVDAINFRNSEVSDALCIKNPDRPGQFLLVPREKASVILMLGMP